MATHAFIRVAAPPVPPPKKAQREPAAEGTRKNPFVATVLENYNLNGPGSDKETRHVVFSLKGSDLTYTVGDALGVVPNNCPDLVRRIIQGSALRGDEEVDVGGELLPLRAALGYRLDCVTVDQKLLRLAARDAHPQAAGEFQRLLDDDEARKVWLTENHVIDVVEAAWMRTDPQELVRVLKPLGPRLYSISSSPLAHPGEVHLTVDVVRYEMRGRTRKGTSSTFIGERCGPGVRVPIFVQSAKFGLTDDDYAPIIMVGPGTGIAPFRAFLEEREARRAEGYSWLIFGARSSATDFLYREQIAAWQASGVLTRFDAAFSRDQGRKVYVQDRMREHGADLFAWLEAGSCFYVCGDAARMARDVNEALLEIISVYGGYDRAGAEAYLARMQAEGRYLRDVY
ncbi:MAG: protein CysJ [Myxococcales bacterium]|nr:protein CysJ [Myxococcales bacterium]